MLGVINIPAMSETNEPLETVKLEENTIDLNIETLMKNMKSEPPVVLEFDTPTEPLPLVNEILKQKAIEYEQPVDGIRGYQEVKEIKEAAEEAVEEKAQEFQQAKEAAEEVVEEKAQEIQQIKEAAEEVVEEKAQEVQQAKEAAEEVVEEKAQEIQQVKEAAEEVVEEKAQEFQQVKEAAEEVVEEKAQEFQQAKEAAEEAVEEKAQEVEQVKEAAEEAVEEKAQEVQQVKEAAEQKVEDKMKEVKNEVPQETKEFQDYKPSVIKEIPKPLVIENKLPVQMKQAEGEASEVVEENIENSADDEIKLDSSNDEQFEKNISSGDFSNAPKWEEFCEAGYENAVFKEKENILNIINFVNAERTKSNYWAERRANFEKEINQCNAMPDSARNYCYESVRKNETERNEIYEGQRKQVNYKNQGIKIDK